MNRELDTKVAEALGWTELRFEEANVLGGPVLVGYNPRSTYAWCQAPFWSRDIAVAWELGAGLAGEEVAVFIEALCNICGVDQELLFYDGVDWASVEALNMLVYATPEQRCRAFLAAKGPECLT